MSSSTGGLREVLDINIYVYICYYIQDYIYIYIHNISRSHTHRYVPGSCLSVVRLSVRCCGWWCSGHARGMTVLPLPPDQELQGDIQVQDVSDIVNMDKKYDTPV